jgi:type IV pilus assembly protein PilW
MPAIPDRTSGLRSPRMRGMTLVELMVAITLSFFIVGALVTFYASASRAKTELDKTSRQIENGRYAIDLLREDVELAGFYGPLPRSTGYNYETSEPDPCATLATDLGFSNSPWTLPAPVQGISAASTASCLPDRKANTAAVLVRRVDPSRVATPATVVTAGNPHLQTTFCYEDTSRFVFSDDPAAFVLRQAFDGTACGGVNYAQRYVQRIYYVATCGRCNPSDGIPTLKRAELVDGGWEIRSLADGIDNLQFEYGFDDPAAPASSTNPPGTPDVFAGALGSTPPATQWANAVTVRVFLLARAVDATAGYTDAAGVTYDMGPAGALSFSDPYKRRLYMTQVRINNVAGPRESSP